MKGFNRKLQRGQGGFLKKLGSVAVAGALAMSMVPGVAMASVMNGKTYYKLPTQPIATQHTEKGVSWQYLTTAAASPSHVMAWYNVLGINNVATGVSYDSTGVENGYISVGASSSQRAGTEIGLFGTEANQNPDEYLWNYACYINGNTSVPDTERMLTSGTMTVNIGGTTYSNMPREIYMECNVINKSSSSDTSGDKTYAQWVELENQRSNRQKTGTYDPIFVTWSLDAGGFAKASETLYKVSKVMDDAIAKSRDASTGVYKLRTRYANGPETYKTAQSYEGLMKGSQYYVLKQIAEKKVAKKTVAVICGYDPQTGNYACRKLNLNQPDSNQYGGRMANCVAQIANDITAKGLPAAQQPFHDTVTSTNQQGQTSSREVDETGSVAWYTPDQIVKNCNAVFICDAPASNGVSSYLATAQDGKAHTVYSATSDTDFTDDTSGIKKLVDAKTKAKNDSSYKGTVADICYKLPANIFTNYYAQGVEVNMQGPIACAYLYPEFFNLTDMMAWWDKMVYHIKDASLQDIVDTTCNDISLSTNQSQIGKISSDFEAKIGRMIAEGCEYYLGHTAAVDAINGGNLKAYDTALMKSYVAELRSKYPAVSNGATAKTSDGATVKVISTGSKSVSYTAAPKKASVTIPATVKLADGKSYKVTTIAAKAFNKNTKVTKVTVGKNVTSIGSSAFNGCTKLKTVKLGSAVKTISSSAFNGCKKLSTLTLSSTKLTTIGKKAFNGCKALKTLTVKSTKLTKKGVKGSLTGSSIKTVKVASSSKKATIKKYKKYFTKGNCGKKVAVK